MEAVIASIRCGTFPDAEKSRLKDGLEKLMRTEAYEDYGSPYALDLWEKLERQSK